MCCHGTSNTARFHAAGVPAIGRLPEGCFRGVRHRESDAQVSPVTMESTIDCCENRELIAKGVDMEKVAALAKDTDAAVASLLLVC